MAQVINVPANVQLQNGTQLTQQIQSSVNRVQFNLGGAKGLRSLSQPLGRLTGQADEFTKSLDAANARVLAFGASVGVVNAVSNAFKALVNSTIEVEKAITEISVVGDQFNGKTKQLSQGLFNIAKTTGQSFSEVSKAALEFSRQGLNLEDTLQRTKDALILTRTTGLDAAKSVDGLTAAVNAFAKAGLSTTQVLNKLAAVDQAFSVSSADLIEAFQRTGAVAQQAGVSFDELAGIVTALQTETSRGGAVIGNALKTIFSRLQDTTVLSQLKDLGIAVVDTKNNILPARQILQNLAGDIEGLGKITQAGVFKDVAGTFQLNQLVSLLGDLNRQQSISAKATQKSAGATNEAYIANEKLNQSLDAILNKVATTGKQVGSLLGEIGLSDNLKGLLDGVNSFLEEVTGVLQGDDLGSKFAKGIVKGIGAILSGPGLGIFLAIIAKLSFDLAKFGTQSLKTFFNIGKAASDQKQIQESIVQILLRNSSVLKDIENTQGGINAQAARFVTILNQELQAIQKVQGLAGGLTGAVYSAGYRQTEKGLQKTRGKAAGGYLPAQEAADVRRGVGGASPNSKVVAIPNFAFGGGKRGTMIANTSEYIVPNYAGGGSAIFNQDMVKTMGLPAGAKKIGAAGGFVPNFAAKNRLKEGRDLESRIFGFLNLPPAGNRNLDFPYPVLSGVKTELKARLGIQGAFGDLKLTDSQENRTSLLGRLIQEFSLFDELQKLTYKKKTAQNIDLNSLNPKIQEAALFFKGNPSVFESIPIEASWAAIRKTNRDKPNFLSKFDPIIYRPDGALKAGAIGSKISAKIFRDGVLDPKDIAAQGYIPNFANFKNSDLAVLGLYGRNSDIDGSPVYTLQNQRPEISKDIVRGYKNRIAGFVNGYAKQVAKNIGIEVSPKEVIKSFAQASNVAGFIFEDVLNQLAGPNFDSNRISGGASADFPLTTNLRKVFGVTGTQRYAEIKLSPNTTDSIASVRAKQAALAGGALAPIETSPAQISALREEAIALGIGQPGRVDTKTQARRMAFIQKMINSGMIKSGYGASADQTKAIKRTLGMASSGYIPNFAASALQQAIAREKSAGLSDSQIYVDQNPSLKSPQNPMGLMVANTRDEPFGGIQGISRARRQGMNPKLYGAANGFVPNYAAREALKQQSFTISIKNGEAFDKKLQELADEVSKQTKSFKAASKELETFVSTLKTVGTKKKPSAPYDAPTQQALLALGKEKLEASKPAKEPKSVGDSLAKVVGIQSAFIGLQSVVESMADEGSDFSKNFKAFGGIISGVTSGITLFTAGLGPIGIALGAVTVGFNLLRDVFPDALQSIKESFGGLSLEGQKASKALDDFAEKVARGGVSVEEALKSAEQQASEAILRTKAKEKGVKTETDTGELKDPTKLARELVIEAARRNQGNLGLGTDIYKKVGTEMGRSYAATYAAPTVQQVAYSKYGNAEALFSDLNESTQNVIFDIFEETVSVNKAGLVALGKKLQAENPSFKAKNFEDLVDEGALQEYRSQLLVSLIGGKNVLPKIQGIIERATTGQGENRKIDEKVVVEELKQSGLFNLVKDYLKEIIPAAAAIEDASEVNIFRANVDDLIRSYSDFSSTLNRAINNRISLLEGLTSSQTFTGLSEQQQFQTKAALDRFKSNTSFQSQKRALTEEVQSTLGATLKDLRATESVPVEKINALANELSTLDVGNLESFLNKFGSTVKLSGDKLIQFNNDVSKFNNKSKDLFANREVEVQLLNFSIQERQTELNAIKTFYNGLDKFNSGIREKEREIRNLDFKKTLSEQTAQYERELAQLTSTSPEELRTRTQAADTKATKDQASIERKQNEIRAKIEAEQAINTVENIKALNRNTEVLQKLLTQFSIKNVQEQIDSIIKGAAGRALTPDEGAQLSALVSQKLALQNPPQSTGDIKDLSSLAFPASRTEIDKKIGELGVLTDDEKAKYKGIFNRYFDQIEDGIDAEKARNDASKNQQGLDDQLFKIKQSYVDDIANELKSLRESQYSPKSIGQFAATERQIKMAQRKESLKNNPEKVREYLSSFGYGFDEAMSKVEERTLDFRNQLGKEIPDLFSQNLAQGLNDAISGAKDLKTALSDAATAFFQEITRKNISNLADIVTGGIGGFFTKKASGGLIRGGSGTKDDVPAMLMGGEYVVKKSAVNKYGKGFLDAINGGSIRGYATGGIVDPQTFPTQTGRGGFFTPGDYGQGAITGKNELLTFASQSFTGGQYDYMGGFGMGGATVSLEPESARLSALGREGSPMFERVQQSKDEAFKVYLEGLQKEKEYADLLDQIAKDKKARKKALQTAIVSAVVTSALNYAGTRGQIGAKNQIAATAGTSKLSGLSKFTAGLSGFGRGIFTSLGNKLTPQAESFYKPPVKSDDFYNPYPSNSGALPLPRALYGGDALRILPSRNSGGLISGGSNIRDDVPAMLTGGEFVLNNRATQRIGLQNLNKLNTGATVSSEGSSPEMTQTLIAKLDELIQTTANSSKENVVVNVSTNEAGGQTTENPAGAEKELHKKIRQAVLDVIAQEKRLGGSLEKSR